MNSFINALTLLFNSLQFVPGWFTASVSVILLVYAVKTISHLALDWF